MILGSICIVFVSFFLGVLPLAASEDRPNVLFIAVDDLGNQLGCYGDPVMLANNGTPHIDALASRGITFLNHHVQWPVCGPSRAALTTSLMPEETGVEGFRALRHPDKLPDVITLPQHFKNHGYETACKGKFHDNRTVGDTTEPGEPGSDNQFNNGRTVDDPASWTLPYAGGGGNSGTGVTGNPAVFAGNTNGTYGDRVILQDGFALLDTLSSRKKPFFLAVGFYKPHLPFLAPEEYFQIHDTNGDGIYDDVPAPSFMVAPTAATGRMVSMLQYNGEFLRYEPFDSTGLPTGNEIRLVRHGYYACVSFIDDLVGQLLAKLEMTPDPCQPGRMMDETTIVVFWGDHGFALGEHNRYGKHTLQEVSTAAPLIIYDPRNPATGATTMSPANTLDIYPTLSELAGLPIPTQPLDNATPNGRPLRGRSLVPVLNDPAVSVNGGAISHKPQGGDAFVFRTERYRLIEWHDGTNIVARDLYDLTHSRVERINVAEDPAYQAILHQLSTAMRVEPSTQGIGVLQTTLPAPAPAVPDVPELRSAGISEGRFYLNWPHTSGVTYRIMGGIGLGESFAEVTGSITGGSASVSVSGSRGFYRVEVDDNLGPVFTEDPVHGPVATEGLVYSGSLSTAVRDLDAGPVTFAKTEGPDWLSVSENGSLGGTPSGADLGGNYFTISATDNEGAVTEGALHVAVDANDTVLHEFSFTYADGAPAGSSLDEVTDRVVGASFSSGASYIATNGTDLVISDAGGSGNVFIQGGPVTGGGDVGVYDIEFCVVSVDLTGSSTGANFGFAIRDIDQGNNSQRDIALLRIQHNGQELLLQSRMDGTNTTFHAFGTETISGVKVRGRAVLNGDDPGTLDVFLDTGSGEVPVGSTLALQGGKTFNGLFFQNVQNGGVWAAGGSAVVDYFRVTKIQ